MCTWLEKLQELSRAAAEAEQKAKLGTARQVRKVRQDFQAVDRLLDAYRASGAPGLETEMPLDMFSERSTGGAFPRFPERARRRQVTREE